MQPTCLYLSRVYHNNKTNIEDNFQQKQIFVEIFQPMNQAAEIFRIIAEGEGMNITSLEKSIGASKGVLSRAINKGSDIQSKWLIALIEKFPNYNYEKLLKGENYQPEANQEFEKIQQFSNQGIDLVRNDIKMLSDGLAQPLERISDGILKILIDQQKILRVTEGLNVDRLNKIGDKLDQLLKQ